MYEKVDTYIYKVGEDNYRIKIQRKDKETGVELKISQNYKLSLDKVKKIRDDLLEEYSDRIKFKVKEITDVQEISIPTKKIKKKATSTKTKEKKVDTYIYQISTNKYRVRIKKGTRGEIGYFQFSKIINGSISEARKLRDKKLAECKLYQTGPSDRGNISLEEFSKIFLENHCSKYSPTTYDGVVSKLNYSILPELGHHKIGKIDTFTLQRFINDQMAKKKRNSNDTVSSTTVNDIYRLLRNILNRAVDWGYIDKNPILKVPTPPVAKNEKLTFNLEEFQDVFNKIKKEPIESQCMFIITMCTGFRRGELIGIYKDEDIDFNEGKIYITKDVVRDKTNHKIIEKDPKTNESTRVVPVPLFCLTVISKYLEWRERKVERLKIKNPKYKEINNLFLSENGGLMKPEYPSKKWDTFIKKYGFKHVTLHGLRHSYCTLQLNENSKLGPNDVQKLLGHSQLTTTFHYSHSNKDKDAEAISIFDNFNNGKRFDIYPIISICTGRKYSSEKEISKLMDYMISIDDLSTVEKMNLCKRQLINTYPNLSNIDDNGVNIDNIFDWLDNQREVFGDSLVVEPVKDLLIENSRELT